MPSSFGTTEQKTEHNSEARGRKICFFAEYLFFILSGILSMDRIQGNHFKRERGEEQGAADAWRGRRSASLNVQVRGLMQNLPRTHPAPQAVLPPPARHGASCPGPWCTYAV